MIRWRSLSLAERQLAFVWGGLVLAMVVLQPLLHAAAYYLRPCVLREVTGVPCPTCGATRGVLALLDGRLLDAVALNPLVAVGALAFLAGGIVAPLWAWRRGTGPQVTRLPPWLRLTAVGLFLANWAWVIFRTV